VSPAATTPSAAQPSAPVQPAPIPERAELKPVLNRNGELSYGPVKYKDTLYAIADEMRPEGVTTNQMMLALVRDNPQAFYHGNINELKAGYVLRIKDKGDLTALSESKANQEVERQLAAWEARKSGKLVAQTGEAPSGGQVARGETPATSTSEADQARLKLVAPGSEGAGSGTGSEKDQIKSLRKDLLLAAEAMDANKQETDELKARLADMEDQLASMQRLIMLKDDEMLALQKQVAKTKPGAAGTTPEAATAESAKTEMTETPAKEAAPVAGATPPEGEATAPAAKEPEKPVAPKPAKPAVPVKKAPKPEPGFLSGILPDFLTENPMVMYGGIGIVILLIVVAVIRKRKGGGFEESILNVGEGGSTADMGATAESMEGNSESTMVSDFAMSEMSGLSGMPADASEVDPVSEADVYLAYGRHQQAEDILKEALAKEPDRHEVKLKLLEVYFAAKNKDAFEQGAQELHDALGDESDPIWAKVVTMGSQLSPDNALFGGASSEAPKEEVAGDIASSDEDLLDFDFDFDSDDSGAGQTETDSAVDDVFAELEAATDTTETTEEPVAELEESAADTGLDFDLDLDTGSSETETTAEAATEAETEDKSDDNSLDFDVTSLDFNLDTDESNEAPAEATSEEDAGGLDFDLDDTITGGDTTSDLDSLLDDDLDSLTEDAFGEVDEVGTKLDLAKAYVDMGDSDGARSILDEVMEEGDDSQKAQAQQLLAQIG
jgi:pilus assembly protein FimV